MVLVTNWSQGYIIIAYSLLNIKLVKRFDNWRRGWDSNPRDTSRRPADFESTALDHSATSPISPRQISFFKKPRDCFVLLAMTTLMHKRPEIAELVPSQNPERSEGSARKSEIASVPPGNDGYLRLLHHVRNDIEIAQPVPGTAKNLAHSNDSIQCTWLSTCTRYQLFTRIESLLFLPQ